MCTSFVGSLDIPAPDIEQRVALAIIGRSPVARQLEFARERGWTHLKFYQTVGDDFARDYRGLHDDGSEWAMCASWKRRGDKVNLFWAAEGDFETADPGFDPDIHGGAIQVLDDLDYLEKAFQEARFGQAATLPFSDTAIPTVFDKTLAPEGVHVMSMFTQWVPAEWADEDGHEEDLEKYADRLIDRMNAVAPNFKGSIMHRQIIGPRQMQQDWGLIGGNIFHGELTVDQLFHMRPAPGYADYRTPIRGLYQASSATHAGGGVTGMPGRHCVREILKDKGVKKRRT